MCYLYCSYRWISNRLIVDMNVKCIDTTEIIEYVIIYIQAKLQWTKVSLATLFNVFYCYFACDAWKCINYCMHGRKLKCIHYSSCNFRLFTFYHKSNSTCKTITTYNPCRYVCWYTYSIFLANKYNHTISCQESFEKFNRYTTYVRYCVVWAIFNKLF